MLQAINFFLLKQRFVMWHSGNKKCIILLITIFMNHIVKVIVNIILYNKTIYN